MIALLLQLPTCNKPAPAVSGEGEGEGTVTQGKKQAATNTKATASVMNLIPRR